MVMFKNKPRRYCSTVLLNPYRPFVHCYVMCNKCHSFMNDWECTRNVVNEARAAMIRMWRLKCESLMIM